MENKKRKNTRLTDLYRYINVPWDNFRLTLKGLTAI